MSAEARNILLILRFNGGAFHGWQVQPNGFTVQEAVQAAVQKITGEPANVNGCSRTDAGVHAAMFCANFKTNASLPCEKIAAALNFYLPQQAAVIDCREAAPDFHARYSCKGKTYCYHVRNHRVRDPFLLDRAVLVGEPLDAERLHRQAQDFVGTHNFAAFCAAGGGAKTTVRTVTAFSVRREGEDVRFTVSADGFLYHMVRIMVGTLLDIARGRLPEGCIPGILAAGSRAMAGVTAPAEGLWLIDVRYEAEDFLPIRKNACFSRPDMIY
ncbi:MAG: tRNA pseudouridine(38-40) synthase TruA [Oscillospiraceae bacterium]|jgi:tRNA pseudouridine38-40 synthase|nr:tRNA pseudouridine(38-40) synthase TruA [Oscillospiraceae bacterium]